MKLHAVISINGISVISFAVTDEHVHDAKAGKMTLESIKSGILRIYGDDGYDSREIFNEFISKVIPARKNPSTKSRRSPARSKVVRAIMKEGEENWKESVHYGRRWSAEIYFSGDCTQGSVLRLDEGDDPCLLNYATHFFHFERLIMQLALRV